MKVENHNGIGNPYHDDYTGEFKSASVGNNFFNNKDTGMSYYNRFLNESDNEYMKTRKGLLGNVVKMTPNEYFDEVSKVFNKQFGYDKFNKDSQKDFIKDSGSDNIKSLMNVFNNGGSLDIPVIDYPKESQE